MGKRREKLDSSIRSSQTLPSSPSHSFSSSSSSDFEFTISVSPRKSTTAICPADELFYKGQLLPLHLSPRISMVRTLLLASSSTSSSSTDTTTTASRDSTGSTSSTSSFASDLVLLAGDCDSSRPSSVTEDDESSFKRHFNSSKKSSATTTSTPAKYFSLSRFSSVFKKDPCKNQSDQSGPSSVKRMSATAKEVIRKYFKKVKPLYEKLSQKQKMEVVSEHHPIMSTDFSADHQRSEVSSGKNSRIDQGSNNIGGFSHSFSGNLRYPRRRSCISSCPSSMRSSPSHSGVLSKNGFTGPSPSNRVGGGGGSTGSGMYYADASSMEELQNAIQGAIAHCKNSMVHTGNSKAVMCNEI